MKHKSILYCLLILVVIFIIYTVFFYKIDNFNNPTSTPASTTTRATTTASTTTRATTTSTTSSTSNIPTTTKQLDTSNYLYYTEDEYNKAINETNNINKNLNNINDKIDLINQVATLDANQLFDNDDIQKKISNNFIDNTDSIINKQFAESRDINRNDSTIQNISDQITDLENIIKSMGYKKQKKTAYNKIKSLNNGQELELINTNYNDNITNETKKGYLVQMNNGCLSVGQNDYNVYKCDEKNPKQHFKMVHVLNDIMYSNNIDKLLPFATPDKTKTNYPFTLIKSLNNDNCLTNNHGEITVQPCSILNAQQFIPLESN